MKGTEVDPREVAAHAAFALAEHQRRLRREHRPVPPGLDVLADLFLGWARTTGTSTAPAATTACAVLTVPQAATVLAVSVSTVKRRISEGTLPSILVGGSRRVRLVDLDRYLADLGSHRVTTGQTGSSPNPPAVPVQCDAHAPFDRTTSSN